MGSSSTTMGLFLNCQWFNCVCDFINKNNGVIGIIIIILVLCFGLYKIKNNINDMKIRTIILLNFPALVFSIMALCMTHPNQLGFDYLGAIVGILAILITVLIGWNIYQLIDLKNIRKNYEARINEIKKDFDDRAKDIESDNFIETTALYNILSSKARNSPAQYLAACINSFYNLKRMKRFSTIKCIALDFPLLFIKTLVDENTIIDYAGLAKNINKRAMDYFIYEFGNFKKEEREEKYKGVENALREMAKYTKE